MIQTIDNSVNTVNFMGRPTKKVVEAAKEIESYLGNETRLTLKAKSYIKRADEAIDLTWQCIRKNKETRTPKFEYVDKVRGTKATLTPIYRGFHNEALLEIESSKNIERILVRRDGTHFRYERALKTDHGSMTGKAFDSTVDKNPEFAEFVSQQIETYIPKMIKASHVEDLQNSLCKSIRD